jgi:protease II
MKLKQYQRIYHKQKISDPYQWIKTESLDSADVKKFLNDEAVYTQQVFKESRKLRKQIYEEISRISPLSNELSTWDSGNFTHVKKEHKYKTYYVYFKSVQTFELLLKELC